MSICKNCCKRRHKACSDNDPKTGRQKTDYRGCPCQHRKPLQPEPATGAPGE